MVVAVTVDDVIAILNAIEKLSPVALAILIVVLICWGFYKKWIVLGPFYSDLEGRLAKTESQRDTAIEMAAKLTDILEAGRRGSYRGR